MNVVLPGLSGEFKILKIRPELAKLEPKTASVEFGIFFFAYFLVFVFFL